MDSINTNTPSLLSLPQPVMPETALSRTFPKHPRNFRFEATIPSSEAISSSIEVLNVHEILENILKQGGPKVLTQCAQVCKFWKYMTEDIQFWKPFLYAIGCESPALNYEGQNLFHILARLGEMALMPLALRQPKFSLISAAFSETKEKIYAALSLHFPTFVNYEITPLWLEELRPKNVPKTIIYMKLPDFVTGIGHDWAVNAAMSNLVITLEMPPLKDSTPFKVDLYYQSRKDPSQIVNLTMSCNISEEKLRFRLKDCDADSLNITPIGPNVIPAIPAAAGNLPAAQINFLEILSEQAGSWWDLTHPDTIHSCQELTTQNSYPEEPNLRQLPVYAWPRDDRAHTRTLNFNALKASPLPSSNDSENVKLTDLIKITPAIARNSADLRGFLPLHLAIIHDKPLFSLVAPRLFHNKTDEGKNALHYAAEFNRNGKIEELLDRGGITVIDVQDDIEGKTPLMFAVRNKNITIIKALLSPRSNMQEKDANGNHPLASANTNVQDNNGETALHYAIKSGNIEIIKLLLAAKADTNVQDNNGKTALHYAIKSGNIKIINLLLKMGAKINIQDKNRKTPLNYAMESKENAKIVTLLASFQAYRNRNANSQA